MAKILVADDELSMRQFLEILLKKEGHEVLSARDGEEALSRFQDNPVRSGHLRHQDAEDGRPGPAAQDEGTPSESWPVIMITAYASPEDAISAMKSGAYDYLTKPFKLEEIKSVIRNALARPRDGGRGPGGNLLQPRGPQPKMVQIYNLIRQVGPTKTNVLISGESGTGKELVARAIHQNSPRGGKHPS
jgi:two-component system, NtrC family, response regulator PilR